MAIHLHFEIVGTIALFISMIGLLFTYIRTRKTDKDKVETFRHKLLSRSLNLLNEMIGNQKEINRIINRIKSNSMLHLEFGDMIDSIDDLQKKIGDYTTEIQVVIETIKGKGKNTKMSELRELELEINDVESKYNPDKEKLKGHIVKYNKVLDAPRTSQ